MRIIDQEPESGTFGTLKKFKPTPPTAIPKFYLNGVEINKMDVPPNGESVIMTNYLDCMEDVLSEQ